MTSEEVCATESALVHYEDVMDLLDEREFQMAITTYRYEGSLGGRYIVAPSDTGSDDVDIEFSVRHEFNLIGLRMAATVEREYGSVVVDVGVNYIFDVPFSISGEALAAFINRVAALALFPYLRESLASLTARVFGNAVVMPVMRQRDFEIRPAPEPEADGADS